MQIVLIPCSKDSLRQMNLINQYLQRHERQPFQSFPGIMEWRTQVFVVLFPVHINICFSHLCFSNEVQTFLKGKLADSDFTPLLSLEDNSYGKLFHRCLFYCEKDKRCSGFQICKISETLFQCRTCCEWKKAKGFTFTYSPDCKYVEMVS